MPALYFLSLRHYTLWKKEVITVTSRNYSPAASDKREDDLSPEEIRKNLPKSFRQIPIEVHPSLDSTNTYAKKIAGEGAPACTVILAEEQTAGKGRQGKHFFAPPKSGIYMTTILRPRLPLSESLILTFAAGVAVCEAIEALTDCRPKIKWVNDIYLGKRKICGILAEAAGNFRGDIPDAIVVGIGINVRLDLETLPEELRDVVGCLFPIHSQGSENAPTVTRNRLAAEIAGRLLLLTERLSGPDREIEKRRLLQEYKQKSLVLGKTIRYMQEQTTNSGIALDICEDGSLLVKNEAGGTAILQSGEITLVRDSLWEE